MSAADMASGPGGSAPAGARQKKKRADEGDQVVVEPLENEEERRGLVATAEIAGGGQLPQALLRVCTEGWDDTRVSYSSHSTPSLVLTKRKRGGLLLREKGNACLRAVEADDDDQVERTSSQVYSFVALIYLHPTHTQQRGSGAGLFG